MISSPNGLPNVNSTTGSVEVFTSQVGGSQKPGPVAIDDTIKNISIVNSSKSKNGIVEEETILPESPQPTVDSTTTEIPTSNVNTAETSEGTNAISDEMNPDIVGKEKIVETENLSPHGTPSPGSPQNNHAIGDSDNFNKENNAAQDNLSRYSDISAPNNNNIDEDTRSNPDPDETLIEKNVPVHPDPPSEINKTDPLPSNSVSPSDTDESQNIEQNFHVQSQLVHVNDAETENNNSTSALGEFSSEQRNRIESANLLLMHDSANPSNEYLQNKPLTPTGDLFPPSLDSDWYGDPKEMMPTEIWNKESLSNIRSKKSLFCDGYLTTSVNLLPFFHVNSKDTKFWELGKSSMIWDNPDEYRAPDIIGLNSQKDGIGYLFGAVKSTRCSSVNFNIIGNYRRRLSENKNDHVVYIGWFIRKFISSDFMFVEDVTINVAAAFNNICDSNDFVQLEPDFYPSIMSSVKRQKLQISDFRCDIPRGEYRYICPDCGVSMSYAEFHRKRHVCILSSDYGAKFYRRLPGFLCGQVDLRKYFTDGFLPFWLKVSLSSLFCLYDISDDTNINAWQGDSIEDVDCSCYVELNLGNVKDHNKVARSNLCPQFSGGCLCVFLLPGAEMFSFDFLLGLQKKKGHIPAATKYISHVSLRETAYSILGHHGMERKNVPRLIFSMPAEFLHHSERNAINLIPSLSRKRYDLLMKCQVYKNIYYLEKAPSTIVPDTVVEIFNWHDVIHLFRAVDAHQNLVGLSRGMENFDVWRLVEYICSRFYTMDVFFIRKNDSGFKNNFTTNPARLPFYQLERADSLPSETEKIIDYTNNCLYVGVNTINGVQHNPHSTTTILNVPHEFHGKRQSGFILILQFDRVTQKTKSDTAELRFLRKMDSMRIDASTDGGRSFDNCHELCGNSWSLKYLKYYSTLNLFHPHFYTLS